MLSYSAIEAIVNTLKQNASALSALESAAAPLPQLQSAIAYLANTQHSSAASLHALLEGDYQRTTMALLGLTGFTHYNLSEQKKEFFDLLNEHLRYYPVTPVSNEFVTADTREGSSYITVTLEPANDSQPSDTNSIQIPGPTIYLRLSSRSVYDVRLYTPVIHPFTGDRIGLSICTVAESEINFMLSQLQHSVGMASYEPLEFYVTSISKLLYEYEQLLYKNRAFQIHGKYRQVGAIKISQLDMTTRETAVSHEVDSVSHFLAKQGDAFITVDDAYSYDVLENYAYGLCLDNTVALGGQFKKYIDYRYLRTEEDKKYGRVSNPFGRRDNSDLRPFYNHIRFLEQMWDDKDEPTSIRVILNDCGETHPWARNLDMTSFEPLQQYEPKDVVKLHLMRLELVKRVSAQYLKNKSMSVF